MFTQLRGNNSVDNIEHICRSRFALADSGTGVTKNVAAEHHCNLEAFGPVVLLAFWGPWGVPGLACERGSGCMNSFYETKQIYLLFRTLSYLYTLRNL